jgi:hypothetical protein
MSNWNNVLDTFSALNEQQEITIEVTAAPTQSLVSRTEAKN